MKPLKPSLAIIAAFVIMLFVCSNSVSAFSAQDGSAILSWTDQQPLTAGTSTSARVLFGSTIAQGIEITRIGIHFDWMAPDAFVGINLEGDPVYVKGMDTYASSLMAIDIPANISSGTHTYYIGIEGKDSSGNFSWNSDTLMVEISNPYYTAPPTNTSNGDGNQNPQGGNNLILYGVIIAVLVVVALSFAVIIVRQKKKPATTPTSSEPPKDTTQPEEKTEKPPGDDFQI